MATNKRSSMTLWFRDDNKEHQQMLEVMQHFIDELKTKNGYKDASAHQLNMAVWIMGMKALAKSKRPDLLLPIEDRDVLLDRIASSMYDLQIEFQTLTEKLQSGVIVQSSDQLFSSGGGAIPGGFSAFEESITEGFMSFE